MFELESEEIKELIKNRIVVISLKITKKKKNKKKNTEPALEMIK